MSMLRGYADVGCFELYFSAIFSNVCVEKIVVSLKISCEHYSHYAKYIIHNRHHREVQIPEI
jgi:hypothetical protein